MVACTTTESGNGHYRDQEPSLQAGTIEATHVWSSFICEAESFATLPWTHARSSYCSSACICVSKGYISMTPIIGNQRQQQKQQKHWLGEEPAVKAPAECDCRRVLNGTRKESAGVRTAINPGEICTPPDTRK